MKIKFGKGILISNPGNTPQSKINSVQAICFLAKPQPKIIFFNICIAARLLTGNEILIRFNILHS